MQRNQPACQPTNPLPLPTPPPARALTPTPRNQHLQYFLPWHFNFFSRHRPLPESVFGEASQQQPLISTRWEGVACTALGETLAELGEQRYTPACLCLRLGTPAPHCRLRLLAANLITTNLREHSQL